MIMEINTSFSKSKFFHQRHPLNTLKSEHVLTIQASDNRPFPPNKSICILSRVCKLLYNELINILSYSKRIWIQDL